MKKWISFIGMLVFLSHSLPVFAQVKPNTDTLKFTYKRYTLKKYKHNSTQKWHLEVYQEADKVFGLEAPKAGHLQFVSVNNLTSYDIDQDGHANMILQQYTSQEREEITWYILSLEANHFKEITQIKALYDTPWLADYDQDGAYEILVKDYAFAHWNADFLDSPYQIVPLRLSVGAYQPALDLMQKELPLDLAERAEKIKQAMIQFYQKCKATYPYEANVLEGEVTQRWGFIPSDLWATLLELYYTGNAGAAKDFLDQSWYEELEGKDAFWQDFQNQAAQSPYWEYINTWDINTKQAGAQE